MRHRLLFPRHTRLRAMQGVIGNAMNPPTRRSTPHPGPQPDGPASPKSGDSRCSSLASRVLHNHPINAGLALKRRGGDRGTSSPGMCKTCSLLRLFSRSPHGLFKFQASFAGKPSRGARPLRRRPRAEMHAWVSRPLGANGWTHGMPWGSTTRGHQPRTVINDGGDDDRGPAIIIDEDGDDVDGLASYAKLSTAAAGHLPFCQHFSTRG